MDKDATKAAFVAYLKESGARDLDSIRAALGVRKSDPFICVKSRDEEAFDDAFFELLCERRVRFWRGAARHRLPPLWIATGDGEF